MECLAMPYGCLTIFLTMCSIRFDIISRAARHGINMTNNSQLDARMVAVAAVEELHYPVYAPHSSEYYLAMEQNFLNIGHQRCCIPTVNHTNVRVSLSCHKSIKNVKKRYWV